MTLKLAFVVAFAACGTTKTPARPAPTRQPLPVLAPDQRKVRPENNGRIQIPIARRAPQGPVLLEHRKHQRRAPCTACHHLLSYEKEATECGRCHLSEKRGNTPSARYAFHRLCRRCHKQQGGPMLCKQCHKGERSAAEGD